MDEHTSRTSNKTRKQKFTGSVYVSSLDVTSLYPNIDHEEGAAACEHPSRNPTQGSPT